MTALHRPGTGSGPITGPDSALLEPLSADPDHFLPRIGADGRVPMAVYAAGFAGGTAPRIGLIVAGVGLDHAASQAALRDLPPGVTLAISPYAHDVDTLLVAARVRGDETLVSIPMEPQSRRDDPGDRALMTNLPAEENARRLTWALWRIGGYVGATGALGRLHGERFAAQPDLLDTVLRTIAGRGLLYIDPRPDAPRLHGVPGRSVDVVIDETAGPEAMDAQLAELVRIARARGSALGLIGAARPIATARLAAWTGQFAAQGLVLAPVSVLAEDPK
ncbi:MAG: divergent polysaccharide deacetylase family protein [Pseudomonadota bacterium]|nr:divergent polysaccharide deacetylase family protein [Pseudomonadota bacterium]